eukprot:TRINITY_DN10637_c0_g1_i1.p1 TRINITY_DN10637_c0_g1~~TRINITY_DN10637_c0_g1_i1.p1  ORF type:complete len:506 (+),score=28.14 TRINITY_DN10637_c0_g1_i1:215-1732(+)
MKVNNLKPVPPNITNQYDIQFIWIDDKISNSENSGYMMKLVDFKGFRSIDVAKDYIIQQHQVHHIQNFVVMSSGSLGNTNASWLKDFQSKNPKTIFKMIIFTANVAAHRQWANKFDFIYMITAEPSEMFEAVKTINQTFNQNKVIKLQTKYKDKNLVEILINLPIEHQAAIKKAYLVSHKYVNVSADNDSAILSKLNLDHIPSVQQPQQQSNQKSLGIDSLASLLYNTLITAVPLLNIDMVKGCQNQDSFEEHLSSKKISLEDDAPVKFTELLNSKHFNNDFVFHCISKQANRYQKSSDENSLKTIIKKSIPSEYLTAYTAQTFLYQELNRELRRFAKERKKNFDAEWNIYKWKAEDALVDWIPYIQGCLLNYKHEIFHFHEAPKLYRGMVLTPDHLRDYKINTIFYWPGFTSTTKNQSVATNWLGNHSILFEITPAMKNTKKYSSAISIESLSVFKSESEILYVPFTWFQVTGVIQGNNSKTVIFLTELDVDHLKYIKCVTGTE